VQGVYGESQMSGIEQGESGVQGEEQMSLTLLGLHGLLNELGDPIEHGPPHGD
jgi:hypothetical protein